jgi:hypothetical protein
VKVLVLFARLTGELGGGDAAHVAVTIRSNLDAGALAATRAVEVHQLTEERDPFLSGYDREEQVSTSTPPSALPASPPRPTR